LRYDLVFIFGKFFRVKKLNWHGTYPMKSEKNEVVRIFSRENFAAIAGDTQSEIAGYTPWMALGDLI